jgi:hypothetical protein
MSRGTTVTLSALKASQATSGGWTRICPGPPDLPKNVQRWQRSIGFKNGSCRLGRSASICQGCVFCVGNLPTGACADPTRGAPRIWILRHPRSGSPLPDGNVQPQCKRLTTQAPGGSRAGSGSRLSCRTPAAAVAIAALRNASGPAWIRTGPPSAFPRPVAPPKVRATVPRPETAAWLHDALRFRPPDCRRCCRASCARR